MFHFFKKKKSLRKNISPSITVEPIDWLLMIKLYVNNSREAQIKCVLESDTTILIGDIEHVKEENFNKGYGSAMVEKLIQFAKENGYSHIYGNLSMVDLDHQERLYHFYEKFGFKITEYDDQQGNYFGRIDLDILSPAEPEAIDSNDCISNLQQCNN
ncbi:MAG: GNAT family N-acetyltransferase [Ruminococcus sp.]|nr:GNAT family N-acetyltransferase [Ruminococcus sp.]